MEKKGIQIQNSSSARKIGKRRANSICLLAELKPLHANDHTKKYYSQTSHKARHNLGKMGRGTWFKFGREGMPLGGEPKGERVDPEVSARFGGMSRCSPFAFLSMVRTRWWCPPSRPCPRRDTFWGRSGRCIWAAGAHLAAPFCSAPECATHTQSGGRVCF